jgi:hypothetical protein
VTALVFAALLTGTVLWFLLPLLPALRELLRPTDAEPLTMVGQDAGELTVFAEGFRAYLRRELPDLLSSGASAGGSAAQLPDGTPVAHVTGRLDALPELTSAERVVSRLVVANGPVSLPGGETFLLELYARDEFIGGPGTVYRAILGERDVRLGAGSTILRWVHAEGNLSAADNSLLAGRATAGGTMRLGVGARFSRLRAQQIVTGDAEVASPVIPPPLVTGTMKLPRTARQVRGFIRVDGDLTIPDDASVVGTLVVDGSLRAGARSRIAGSVKVHGECDIGDGALIEGSLVARQSAKLGSGAVVLGPVVAERAVSLGAGCVVGAPTRPASVAAEDVTCQGGVQVYGAISARSRGMVARR